MKRSIALFLCSLWLCLVTLAQNPAGQPGSAAHTVRPDSTFTGASTPNGFSMIRGINISHWLSQVFRQPIKYADQDAAWLSTMGFDNVRLPIDEVELWDSTGAPIESNWSILYEGIDASLKHHLKAVIDLHIVRDHYFNAAQEGRSNPLFSDTAAQHRFLNLWHQISARLSHYPDDQVAYEILNEPVAPKASQWNEVMLKSYHSIRQLEPKRTIVIGSNMWQSATTFPALDVPQHDPNIILSFHSYLPMLLTHYRASWVPTAAYDGPVKYPGIPVDSAFAAAHYPPALVTAIKNMGGFKYWDRDAIAKTIAVAVDRARQLGLPIQCGEFGCLPTAGRAPRLQYYKDIMSIFKQYNIAFASWDYHGSFSVVENENLHPDLELIGIITGK
jgi:endoglucanase